jgi:hypothetical protein
MTDNSYTTNDGTDFPRLLASGFSANEARRLVHMKNHMSEKREYRETLEESRRLDFMRWLIAHDRIER